MMNVVWRQLTLSGFGRYESKVTLNLQPGLNVIIADNERGKSTLLAGLVATLFGLPAVSDPTEFGQAKFRNWNDRGTFEGELQFAKGDVVYRVRRKFANHSVTVSVQTDEGWKDELSGEHNPRARRRNVQYEHFLKETVGMTDETLFMNVFAFGSPLPEPDRLDDDIQQLLSGAGTGHYADAVARLQQAALEMTKFSKAIGVAPRDRNNDRELELLRQRAEQLEEQLRSSREAVDEQQQLQLKLQELEETRHAAAEERRRAEASLQAWNGWRDARARHRRWLGEQSKLLQAYEQHNEISRQVNDAEARLKEEFPEFDGAGADVGDKLQSLRDAEAQAATERAARKGDIAATVKRAAEKLDAWRAFAEKREELRRLDALLADKFTVFTEADEASRDDFANYETRRDKLTRRVHEAEAAVKQMQAEAERRRQEQARFAAQYGDLDELDDDAALKAIDERLAGLQLKDELLAKRAAVHEGGGASSVDWGEVLLRPGSAVGLFVALVVGWGGAQLADWPGALGGFVVSVAAYAFIAAGRARRVQRAAALQRLNEQLEQLEGRLAGDGRLGSFAQAGAHELGVLSERLSARKQAAAALARDEDARGVVAGPESEVAAERELQQARDALAQFAERVRPAVERFGDTVARSYSQWQTVVGERNRLQAELQTWGEQRFGVPSLQPEAVVLRDLPAGRPANVWSTFAHFAVIAVGSEGDNLGPTTVGELLDVLTEWTEDGADRVVDAVLAAEGSERTEAQQRAVSLRSELAGVLQPVEGDVSEAAARWHRFTAGRGRIEDLRSQQRGLLAGLDVDDAQQLHVKALDAQSRAADARRELERLSEQHVALPRPDETDDGDNLDERVDRLQRAVADARLAEEAAAEERRRGLERAATLGGSTIVNIAAGELELAALRRREEQLQFEIDATALAYRELVAAAEQYEQTHRDVLADGASRYIQQFTGRARRVVFDEQFHIQIHDPDGPVHTVAQLSQGARDQLYLAVRLAIADFVGEEAPLPLLLDDPFVHCDSERLGRIREALHSLHEGRQIVLLSHRRDFETWGLRSEPAGEGWER